jgi:hypothetical protein
MRWIAYTLATAIAVALAAFAIVSDHMTTHLDAPASPVQGHTVDATTSLPPRPAKTGSHP